MSKSSNDTNSLSNLIKLNNKANNNNSTPKTGLVSDYGQSSESDESQILDYFNKSFFYIL